MKHTFAARRQRGASLIELLIAVGITMFLVSAAGYVYLLTRESQGASERTSARDETGAFVLQLLGREIMNAGFYPATMPPPPPIAPASPVTQRQVNTVSSYPPALGIPTKTTDWIAPHVNYLHAIYGCEGSKFDHVTATCGTVDNSLPDSIVINYFTNESKDEAATMGQRRDCTGADVGNDDKASQSVNRVRKLNSPTPIPAAGIVALTEVSTIAPQQPLFVSNRYGLNAATKIIVNVGMDNQDVITQSLSCSGNGSSFFGTANTAAYQPILAGIDDMQFTYGVFNTESTRAPDRFYRADQVNALGNVVIAGVNLGPWERVVAVRVCLMTSTLGGNTKIADKTGALRTYLNCADQPITQLATDLSLHKRHVQIFGVRNRLNQGF